MDAFNVLATLGKGTFGTVFLCERKHNKSKIVVKEINVGLQLQQLQEAKNEVNILKSLEHPNVIRYYDSLLQKNAFLIIMEYANKGNLHDLIKERNHNRNYFSEKAILIYFSQIVNGLNHIHSKNIMHRDMKCENIFLTGSNADVIKIGDFGISKILENDNKTHTVIGTTNYIAPEICQGRPYDMKSDIWSLGCILYELCALDRMFDGPISNVVLSISSGRKKIIDFNRYNRNFQYMIDIMLQLNPNNRPSAANIMKFPFLYPYLYLLGVNLGCINNGF